MNLCATFVLYYLTNTAGHKTINKLNNNPTDAAAYQVNQQNKGESKLSQWKNKLNN